MLFRSEEFISAQMQLRGGAAATPADAVAPFSVLVVDGDPVDRDQLRALVVVAVPGARVVCAGNGFDALIAVGRAMPDLIVVDIALPHMDGLEMIRHLCAPGDARPPAIVALSAQPPARLEGQRGLPPGVVRLVKPVEPAKFVVTVNRALDGS